jgi:hypothetical protein
MVSRYDNTEKHLGLGKVKYNSLKDTEKH